MVSEAYSKGTQSVGWYRRNQTSCGLDAPWLHLRDPVVRSHRHGGVTSRARNGAQQLRDCSGGARYASAYPHDHAVAIVDRLAHNHGDRGIIAFKQPNARFARKTLHSRAFDLTDRCAVVQEKPPMPRSTPQAFATQVEAIAGETQQRVTEGYPAAVAQVTRTPAVGVYQARTKQRLLRGIGRLRHSRGRCPAGTSSKRAHVAPRSRGVHYDGPSRAALQT